MSEEKKSEKKKYYVPIVMFLSAFLMYVLAALPIFIRRGLPFFYYGDYNVQQIPFYLAAHRAVENGDFFWNWNIDLGGTMFGDFAFYLWGSPFFWITMLFDESAIPYLMPFLMALKYATAATCAYEAGKRAVADFLRNWNVNGAVVDTKHNGFFRVIYGALNGTGGEINAGGSMTGVADIFKNRFDIGIIGGPLIKHSKITGGIIDETRTCPLEGANINYSGYMHRNILQQDAIAVDIRFMFVRKELLEALSKIAEKTEYREIFTRDLTNNDSAYIDMRDFIYTKGIDDLILQNLSYELCKQCEMEGYRVFYEPSLEELS